MYKVVKDDRFVMGRYKKSFDPYGSGSGRLVLQIHFIWNTANLPHEVGIQISIWRISSSKPSNDFWQSDVLILDEFKSKRTPLWKGPPLEIFLWKNNFGALMVTVEQSAQDPSDPFLTYEILEEEICSEFQLFVLKQRVKMEEEKLRKERRRHGEFNYREYQ